MERFQRFPTSASACASGARRQPLHPRSRRRHRRSGWSILELVITLFVIVDVLALLLPWLDSLREPVRANGCEYHLELLGKAAMQHAALHEFYPSGGWGNRYVGDPDRGFGAGSRAVGCIAFAVHR